MAIAKVDGYTVSLEMVGVDDVEHVARLATVMPVDVTLRQQRVNEHGGTARVAMAHEDLWPVDAIIQLVTIEAFARGKSPREVLDDVLSGFHQPDVRMAPGWKTDEQG